MTENKKEFYVSRKRELSNTGLALAFLLLQIVFAMSSENGMTSVGKWFDYVLVGIGVIILVIVLARSFEILKQRGPVFILTSQELVINFSDFKSTHKWTDVKSISIERISGKRHSTGILKITTTIRTFEFEVENLNTTQLELRREFEKFGGEQLWN